MKGGYLLNFARLQHLIKMKNKKYIKAFLLITFSILLMSLINAEASFTFKQNSNAQLEIPVFEYDITKCASCSCDITIDYPNGSNIIRSASTIINGHYALYNLNKSSGTTSLIGNYKVDIHCNNGADNGASTFEYQITPTGQERINAGEGLSLIGSLVVIILVTVFLFAISFKFENWALKIVFLGSSAVMVFIGVLQSMVIMDNNLGGFTGLVEAYSGFFIIIRVMVVIAVLVLTLGGLYVAMKWWQWKRGFLD